MKARMKETIPAQNAMTANCENAYASSSRPRSVVPWNDVWAASASVVSFGLARAAVLS